MHLLSPRDTRTTFMLGVITFLTLSIAYPQQFNVVQTDEGLRLMEAGETLFFYQAQTKSMEGSYPRANYVHPLQGIHGEVLTEDFPADHLHQRGIFWAWHQVIVENKRVADGWECKDLAWDVKKLTHELTDGKLDMSSKVYWMGQIPSQSKTGKLFKEKTRIIYTKPSDDLIELEFTIELKALRTGTKLGGSEDVKGYGGFSARVYLPDDLEFHARSGEIQAQNTAVQAGNWIEMKGSFSKEQSKQSSITLMNHPDNPLPFPGWILRKRGSMQNPVWPGEQALELTKGVPVTLRYKIMIHKADWTTEAIEQKFQEYSRRL